MSGYSSITLVLSTLRSNNAYHYGGGIAVVVHSLLDAVATLIIQNVAGQGGGGLHVSDSTTDVQQSSFVRNVGGFFGGGGILMELYSNAVLQSSLLSENYVSVQVPTDTLGSDEWW